MGSSNIIHFLPESKKNKQVLLAHRRQKKSRYNIAHYCCVVDFFFFFRHLFCCHWNFCTTILITTEVNETKKTNRLFNCTIGRVSLLFALCSILYWKRKKSYFSSILKNITKDFFVLLRLVATKQKFC